MPDEKNFKAFVLDLLQTVVLALAIFLLVYLFLFQPHQVKGDSMVPNFQGNEYLLTDKVSYRFDKPRRGDVIVFAAPPSPGEDYIKRIIGLPGETVMIKEGRVYINNQILKEDYLSFEIHTTAGLFSGEGREVTLNHDEYFVIGDNRSNSSDSRRWGPVRRKKIVGRAWFTYWPPATFGFVKYAK